MGFTACGDGPSASGGAAIVRDSAGIEIVENFAPRWAPGSGWKLAGDPLVIGSMDGPPEYQLFRVTAARRLSDGRILVANRGTGELRYFGGNGEHLLSVGTLGSGPGEYQGITAIEQHGDSLFIVDQALQRISVLDLDGTFSRSFSIGLPRTQAIPSGMFSDGTLIFGGIDIALDPGGMDTGRRRDPMRYYRLGREGEVLDTLGPFEGPERVARVLRVGDQTAVTVVFNTFGPAFTMRGRGDRFVAALGRSAEISFLSPSGSVERLVRWPFTPEPVSDADIRRNAEFRRAEAEARGAAPDPAGDPEHADFFPAHGPAVLDAAGRLWVANYRRPWEEGPLSWKVFDPDGIWLGEVEVPGDIRMIFEIGEDYLIGLVRDDVDVEYVQLFGLLDGEE